LPNVVEIDVTSPIVWRLSLASPPERVFELLDSDEGRVRFWAARSRVSPGGFELEFPDGVRVNVEILERKPPSRMTLGYLGARAEFELATREDGGCLFQVTCHTEERAALAEFLPGWVSWLLVLKGAADFGIDLRNGDPERTWAQRYVDQ
jgi:uncharacterized protein YndB with AHSA1/START domain